LRENNKDILIADNNEKLNDKGKQLLGDRAAVSIMYNQVKVTIYELQYNDRYYFSVFASGGRIGRFPAIDKKTFTIENVQGKHKETAIFT